MPASEVSHPVLQAQMNDPGVSEHSALVASQLSVSRAHSSTLEQVMPASEVSHPVLQAQVKDPRVSEHSALVASQLSVSRAHSSTLEQVMPASEVSHPVLQAQVKDPRVSEHSALVASQLSVSRAHSSTLEQVMPASEVSHPVLQAQVNEPTVSEHCALESQLSAPSVHSSELVHVVFAMRAHSSEHAMPASACGVMRLCPWYSALISMSVGTPVITIKSAMLPSKFLPVLSRVSPMYDISRSWMGTLFELSRVSTCSPSM